MLHHFRQYLGIDEASDSPRRLVVDEAVCSRFYDFSCLAGGPLQPEGSWLLNDFDLGAFPIPEVEVRYGPFLLVNADDSAGFLHIFQGDQLINFEIFNGFA